MGFGLLALLCIHCIPSRQFSNVVSRTINLSIFIYAVPLDSFNLLCKVNITVLRYTQTNGMLAPEVVTQKRVFSTGILGLTFSHIPYPLL